MTKTLTHADIHDFLKIVGASIELDQLRVDAVPSTFLQPPYNDEMWRIWRVGHVAYINKLLPTVDAMPGAMLGDLAGIATAYEPKVIGQIVLELFADAVSGSCPGPELATAERLFGWLIKQANDGVGRKQRKRDAKVALLKWLPVNDPLKIALDEECEYGKACGFVG
jgi:hypothetical protein